MTPWPSPRSHSGRRGTDVIEPTDHFLASVKATSTEQLQTLVREWGSRTTPRLWKLGDGPYILEMVRELRSRGEEPGIDIEELKGRLQ